MLKFPVFRFLTAFFVTLVLCGTGYGLDTHLSKILNDLPRSFDTIVYVDYRDLRDSPLYQKYSRNKGFLDRSSKDLKVFTQETGVDPDRDIDGIMMGLSTRESGGGDVWIAAITGDFQTEKLEAALKKNRADLEEYLGVRIHRLKNVKMDDSELGIAFPDKRTAVMGEVPTVKSYLDVRKGKAAGIGSDPDMMGLAGKLKTEGQIWGLFRGQALMQRLTGQVGSLEVEGLDVTKPLESFKAATVSAYVGKVVEVKTTLLASSAQDARSVADLLRGLISLGKFAAAEEKPEWKEFLEECEVDHDGEEVSVLLVLNERLLDSAWKTNEAAESPGR